MRSSPGKATRSGEEIPGIMSGLQRMEAAVLNIQRMSTEDGPGIRTTVFFKGCSLACTWCHNPESIDLKPRTVWSAHKCIGCQSCDGVCPGDALVRQGERVWPEPDRCQRCGACADECPTVALEVLGRMWTLADLGYSGLLGSP